MSTMREQILSTTRTLLEKQGYHGTGLNEIVRESGAPKGSLYYYFPDGKEQIVAEAVIGSGKETAERIQAGLMGSGSASKAVYDFVMLVAENVERSGFSAGSPLTAVAMETVKESERINLACREAYELLRSAFLAKLVESGFTQAKAKELSTFIIASVEGGIILSRTQYTADPLRTVAKHLKYILANEK